MTKALPPAMKPGVAFPWGLIAQVVLLVLNVIEKIVENSDRNKK